MSAVREPVMRLFAPSVIRHGVRLGVLATFGLALAGCSGSDVARGFGLQRSLPDEYAVTTRAPLSMPPSEKLALPGAASANRPDESPRMQALETLAPDVALHPNEGTESVGQEALVQRATSAARGPNNAELGDADAGFVDSLLFWRGGRAGNVVDGEAENRRIQKNAALGQSFAEGATPTLRKGGK
ncbi:DUF3035 domain-containing protein [Bombella sp. ESL0380]|uniref:DUF3035 domain-containing protein n=2 Tax=Bombella TaxID=1654741 RepID=UPI0038CF9E1C